jgi:hypothetical protein
MYRPMRIPTVPEKESPGFIRGEDVNKAGTYKINAEAWPIGVTDINPANNKDEATVIVKEKIRCSENKS